jgi:ABC-type spermidine/putrescine transport system permease subunit II
MKQKVIDIIKNHIDDEIILQKPKKEEFGHFAVPVFKYAKQEKKNPMEYAKELSSSFENYDEFESVEAIGGFINFKLSDSIMNEMANRVLEEKENFGKAEKEETILLEYISANPTGPMHIGHARGAIYGDAILRIGRHLGYKITSEYYVNDAGNQIRLLGVSVYLSAREILNYNVEWPEEFYSQWLGKKSYISISGKGDSGVHPELPNKTKWVIYSTVLPWALLTFIIYIMIMFGGFVEMWGIDHSFTLKHYIEAFSVEWVEDRGLLWTGTAWNSFNTTFTIALISSFPTAAIGILTAYLLTRHRFKGKNAFEFGTMLSFAIPGSVIGVSYVFAFNVPPLELTGTGIILVIAFVFRNMPVGVRAGIAAMNQLDPHLDEASSTLNASSAQTFRNIILPLLKPAITASLVFSFVRAMTAISAVIFLVSANYDLAVSYILGRLENNDYGLAIVYSSALIVVMLFTIMLMQLIIGKRKLGRRDQNSSILQGI